MEFENKYIDELIEYRKASRENKNWKLSDEIRDYLDVKLVFIFDSKFGQEIHYLHEEYFKKKDRHIETAWMSNRQYLEYRIKHDINLDKNFDAWLYSTQKGAGLI